MTAAMEKEREAFERWYAEDRWIKVDQSALEVTFRRVPWSGNYRQSSLQVAYEAWLARSLASPLVPVEAIRHGIDELDDDHLRCIAKASAFREESDSHKKWMEAAKTAEQHADELRSLLPEEKA